MRKCCPMDGAKIVVRDRFKKRIVNPARSDPRTSRAIGHVSMVTDNREGPFHSSVSALYTHASNVASVPAASSVGGVKPNRMKTNDGWVEHANGHPHRWLKRCCPPNPQNVEPHPPANDEVCPPPPMHSLRGVTSHAKKRDAGCIT